MTRSINFVKPEGGQNHVLNKCKNSYSEWYFLYSIEILHSLELSEWGTKSFPTFSSIQSCRNSRDVSGTFLQKISATLWTGTSGNALEILQQEQLWLDFEVERCQNKKWRCFVLQTRETLEFDIGSGADSINLFSKLVTP